MCGRVASRHSAAALQRVLGVSGSSSGASYRPSYNAGPGTRIPVIRKKSSSPDDSAAAPDSKSHSTRENVLDFMKWGLVPSYTKSPKDGGMPKTQFNLINARSEGLTKSGAFRRLLKSRRCVAVVDGFYEWEKLQGGKKKQPYFIHTGQKPKVAPGSLDPNGIDTQDSKGPDLLRLAALYDVWHSDTGEVVHSVTILTTAATQKFARIHDRMPVVLATPERVEKWLDCESTRFEDCIPLLSPYKENGLSWYKVSEYVGNIRNKKAECMEPLEVVKARRMKNGIGRFFVAKPKISPAKATTTGASESRREMPSIELAAKSTISPSKSKPETIETRADEPIETRAEKRFTTTTTPSATELALETNQGGGMIETSETKGTGLLLLSTKASTHTMGKKRLSPFTKKRSRSGGKLTSPGKMRRIDAFFSRKASSQQSEASVRN
mmetsp:Transcript_15328/g.30024  ORF Transcript_15328/g.30024 Transcript_15328/m.30024 type:complete len:438 (+) Transcript_15328:33-1346(+)